MTNFTLGQQVTNFGMTATVVGFHKASGSLIIHKTIMRQSYGKENPTPS